MDFLIWLYRKFFCCKRWIEKFFEIELPYEKVGVHTDNLPWFWVGASYMNQDPIDMTDVVNKSLEYGVRVTPEYLRIVTGLDGAQWRYVDVQTLEEKDFPSDGFIIEDVTRHTVSDS